MEMKDQRVFIKRLDEHEVNLACSHGASFEFVLSALEHFKAMIEAEIELAKKKAKESAPEVVTPDVLP
jgi:hypothetical protein